MENNQNQKNGNSFGILFLLIGLVLGGTGGYLFSKMNSTAGAVTDIPNDYGSVNKINGLYVFIESNPVNKDKYSTIETCEGNDVSEVFEKLGNLHGHIGEVTGQIADLIKGFSFEEKLSKLTEGVHEKYGDAEAIIITSTMTKCEVIKFN